MLVSALWHSMWGRGQEGAMAPAPLFRLSATPSTTHNQIGTFWCWFWSGWVCALSRPLWVSPVNSPVRLGVSPAASSTPTGVFNQRFEALFPLHWSPGLSGLLRSPAVTSVYLCANVGPQGLFAVVLHALFIPQSATSLGPPAAALPPVLSASAAHLRPSYWSGWMFLLYLLGCQTSMQFDFLSVVVVFCF